MLNSLMAAMALVAVQDMPPVPTDIPVLAPAVASADCGGLVRVPAFCVATTMAETSDLADAYVERLATVGWLTADGDDNRLIFVKRREGGGCDGLQMAAVYDTSHPQAPEEPVYLAFATIPGDICVAPAGGAAQ